MVKNQFRYGSKRLHMLGVAYNQANEFLARVLGRRDVVVQRNSFFDFILRAYLRDKFTVESDTRYFVQVSLDHEVVKQVMERGVSVVSVLEKFIGDELVFDGAGYAIKDKELAAEFDAFVTNIGQKVVVE